MFSNWASQRRQNLAFTSAGALRRPQVTRLLISVLTILVFTSCATRSAYSPTKAPVVAYMHSLILNGHPVRPGECRLEIQGVAIDVSNDSRIEAEVPIGYSNLGTIKCDLGLLLPTAKLDVRQRIEIKPDVVNILASFDWKLSTEYSAPGVFLVGGEFYGDFKFTPMSVDDLKIAFNRNPELEQLKQFPAIRFEYVRVAR
jgi:hypothetical protein